MQTRFDLPAEQRQVFPQADPTPQLGDRRLTLANLVRWRGFQQPTGQRILARLGTRLAQQFEDRAYAEEIEIARMNVFAVSIALARLTGPRPGPVQSRQSSLMEDDATIRPFPSADHPIVHEQKRNEAPGREQHPAPSDPASQKRKPQNAEGQQKDREPDVGETLLPTQQLLGIAPPMLESLLVDQARFCLRGVHHHPTPCAAHRAEYMLGTPRSRKIGLSGYPIHLRRYQSVDRRA
jgi:hypothetical protein